jgi:hypothetical protein
MEHHPEKFQKLSVNATIQTITQQIRGKIYVRQWERVKTMLDNMVEPFLAVTDAEVYNPRGELVHRSAFLAVQKAQIMWIDPRDEPESNA